MRKVLLGCCKVLRRRAGPTSLMQYIRTRKIRTMRNERRRLRLAVKRRPPSFELHIRAQKNLAGLKPARSMSLCYAEMRFLLTTPAIEVLVKVRPWEVKPICPDGHRAPTPSRYDHCMRCEQSSARSGIAFRITRILDRIGDLTSSRQVSRPVVKAENLRVAPAGDRKIIKFAR